MQGKFGATSNTPDNLLLDAGVIYKDYVDSSTLGTLLGATRGGVDWTLGRNMRDIEFDGAMGPTKGMKRRETIEPTLSASLLEMTPENLLMAIAGGNSETVATNTVITGGELEDADYIGNITYLGTISGSAEPVRITLKNVLVQGDWSVSSEHQNEAVLPVTFAAHFDLDDLDEDGNFKEPWEIEIGGTI